MTEDKVLISGSNVFINADGNKRDVLENYEAKIQTNQSIVEGDEIIGRGFMRDNITVYKIEKIASSKKSKVEGYNIYDVTLSWRYVKADTLSLSKLRQHDSKLARSVSLAIKNNRV